MDSNSTIFKSAAKFFSGTLISRVTGYLRDLSLAFSFGTAAPLAAFFTAFRLSHVPRRLLGEGGLQTAFIPHYEELKKEDPEKAKQFFIDLNVWLFMILLVLTTLIMGALWLFSFWIESEILSLTLAMMPGLVFICLYGLNTGLLECEKSFFTPSVAPVAFNLVWIITALLLMNTPLSQAMMWLSIAITFACLGQWLVTVPKVHRIIQGKWFSFNLRSEQVKNLWKPLFLANLGIIATQINSALDPLFARVAHPEGPAWLWFAIRIEQVPLALFGIALSGALLPPLARAVKEGDSPRFNLFLKTALVKSSYLMVPITLLIFLLGTWGVTLAFGYGDFSQESIQGTTACLWGYGIGLLFQTWVLILAPAFFARKDYKTPAKGAVLAVIANTIFNSIAIFGLKMGPESVAYATSLSSVVNVLFLFYELRRSSWYKQKALA